MNCFRDTICRAILRAATIPIEARFRPRSGERAGHFIGRSCYGTWVLQKLRKTESACFSGERIGMPGSSSPSIITLETGRHNSASTIWWIVWGMNTPMQKQRRSEEHTSELQSRGHLVCRLLLEKKKTSIV